MSSKIRIAHVTQAMGGVKTHIKYIMEYADRSKYCFEVIAPYDKELAEFAHNRNIKYHVIKLTRNISMFKDVRALWKLYFLLKKNRYDIVHLHSAKAGVIGRLACSLLNQKSVFTPNGYSYLGAKGFKRILYFSIETIFKNKCSRVFAVSNCEANRSIYELGLDKEKVVVIKNAILPYATSEKRHYNRVNVISTIARLTYQKNIIRFIEVAKDIIERYPHLEFRILGAGYHDDQKVEINKLIEDYGLVNSVKIISWSDNNSVHTYLAGTDIYISTSIFEGLPYSVLEAMSLGIPCVASFCDGNNDIIEHYKNGFLCNENRQYTEVLSELIEEKDLRVRIGENAMQSINCKFDINARSIQLSEEYKKILEK